MTGPAADMPVSAAKTCSAMPRRCWRAADFGREQAEQTAEVLVWANARGVDSHGVLRIPRYVEMVEAGTINPYAEPAVVERKGAISVLEAARAPGATAMVAAMQEAIEQASTVWRRLVLRAQHHPCRCDRLLRSAGRGKGLRRHRDDRFGPADGLSWLTRIGGLDQSAGDRGASSNASRSCSTCRPPMLRSAR